MLAWRVYYADREPVDSRTDPGEVPARGVLAIVQRDDAVGRLVIAGHDYYTWRDGEWYGVFDQFGLWDYLAQPGLKRVLFGRTVSSERYREVYEQAVADEDFPVKSAWDSDREQERERPPGVTL